MTGFLLAIFMANAGGAWDNAKKFIEAGAFGGKGSDAHRAALIGDTVGDPFKDTSGPAMNIVIKVMTIVSLIFASSFWTESEDGSRKAGSRGRQTADGRQSWILGSGGSRGEPRRTIG